MRVYEFAKKHAIPNKELIALLQSNGFEIESHMALLPPEAIEFLDKKYSKKETKKPEKPTAGTSAPMKSESSQPLPKPVQKIIEPRMQSAQKTESIKEKNLDKELVVTAMTVADLAQNTGKGVSEVILTLLKQGVAATKNQVLDEKTVERIVQGYGIKTVKAEEQKAEAVSSVVTGAVAEGNRESRLPVVVVIGHVDHGKTTLLDFIRKTRVALREKGGITQHLGAYEAQTDHGNVVFLDTPGHEAFSRMRVRGLKVADIAILVVAADDGIMPQTIEAIKRAKEVGLPVVVAINKIDKATAGQIEAVKRGLAQHELMPEDWGGETVIAPISAKTGQGVNELLEVVVLQSQLMELTANTAVPAQGFVLESKLEKGRGPVATVICQHGILHVGDYFVSGTTHGKVSSLVDSTGKRIQSARPSTPVQIAGFSELPQAGDSFQVVAAHEIKKARAADLRSVSAKQVMPENALNLIIKADNASSKEALLGSLAKMSGKAFKELYVLNSAVGSITESDIILAGDTKSIIYGLHVKVEPNAATLAQKLGVTIKLFDIIYKLLEDLEVVAEQGRPVKKVLKKIGEAVVLKVFDIKGLGVIAGAQVKTGIFKREGKVVVWRGKHKVGEGAIKSLQRDKKAVKEVHAGFECAFMIEGFDTWDADDRVECYTEVAEA